MVIIAILGLFAAMALPAQADIYSTKGAQFTNSATGPFYANTSSNLTTLTATPATLTVNSDPVTVRQSWGLAILPQVQGTNASVTANATNIFDVGVIANGVTNWTTTGPIKIITPLNGATAVIDYSNIPRTTLDNVAFIRWSAVGIAAQTGTTNQIVVKPPLYSYSLSAP